MVFLFFRQIQATQNQGEFTMADENSFNDLIQRIAGTYGLDPNLIKAIIKTESNFNAQAINPNDPSWGLCQITPGLAQDFGLVENAQNLTQEDIEAIMNPENNIEVCCWFISSLENKGYPFDEYIQMYNVGESGFLHGKRNLKYLKKVRENFDHFSGE